VDNQEICTSRNIPLPVQREVRQRCGFGCVICGLPLYEYEHMEGWAKVKRHVAEEITLLCDQHHREKTGGLLPVATVRAANSSPHNLRQGVSKPYTLHFSGSEAEIEIGSNSFTCQDRGYGTVMVPLSIDGTPLVGLIIADGHLLLNLIAFDEFNRPILHIKNNQLFYSTIPWDIQLVGTVLTVREAHRKILLQVEFLPPNKVNIRKGRFLRNGVEVLVKPDEIYIVNNGSCFRKNRINNCYGGLMIGPHEPPMPGFAAIDGIPRYFGDRRLAGPYDKALEEE